MGSQLGLADTETAGLTDLILDPDRPLESAVQHRLPFNLAVLTAGRPPAAPYEVLKSPRLGALLEEARRHYDSIVKDTPPLVPVPDGRLIARSVDGLVTVVAAHRTPRKLVEEGLTLLDPSRVVGLVFNGDARPLSGYYGRYVSTGARRLDGAAARAARGPARRREGSRDPPARRADGPRRRPRGSGFSLTVLRGSTDCHQGRAAVKTGRHDRKPSLTGGEYP
ncbi:MAG: hypothetical protein HYS34_06040 [Acidobacteria bacterium]|nr:hypothetical protein [Acidobacteriota bacterium]